ncbi:MAG: glutamate synthase subunit alpha, partial [candidate division Zixibacteria bacterium]|nr:glutamate synthase subunit alpha [candidate division Zixibacteria bacterium]
MQYQGLYDPSLDRDACGVGVVANLTGQKTHDIIRNAIRVLINLEHRGACGCDPETGDGAGLLFQMPHEFFARQCEYEGITLPRPGTYGVGMVFLPRATEQHRLCERLVEKAVWDEDQVFLGWRDVPVDYSQIGRVAHEVSPLIRQFFVARGEKIHTETEFERKLYVIRKVIEHGVDTHPSLEDRDDFYISSLSSKTIVYKGLLMADQLDAFYRDLSDESIVSALALVHSRYSTNTLGSWRLAHPYRMICHNGEINTVRGNQNWIRAREGLFSSSLFGDDMAKLSPIIREGSSDTACFDNALELLYATGRSLPHAMMMMIPEAWENHESMSPEKKAFYEYHSCLMEPWDGPALIAACDGDRICTTLDRNGLRPFRYLVTKDRFVVGASEIGVLDIPEERILYKGRLQPGRLFLIDTVQGRIVDDEEIKQQISSRKPYGQWLAENRTALDDLSAPPVVPGVDLDTLQDRQRAFGYTDEELKILIGPMAAEGEEPVGSMGNDTPVSVLSNKPQLLFHYFKQLFAQVTNPPLDAIREELVTSLESFAGSEQDLFDETPEHCRQLRLRIPVLSNAQIASVKMLDHPGLKTVTLPAVFSKTAPVGALEQALETLCIQAADAIRTQNATLLVLSDRGVDANHIAIPSLLAVASVHHHLIREGLRTRSGLIVESGEPREVMHCCLLIGYGAAAVNPYLMLETAEWMRIDGLLKKNVSAEKVEKNLLKALSKGVLKTMSKMGISTVQAYRGAQIFEAIGLRKTVIDRYFTWTASRIEGIGLEEIEREYRTHHHHGYPERPVAADHTLDVGGYYQWRKDGEYHLFNPQTIALLQISTRTNDSAKFREYTDLIDKQTRQLGTLRSLFEFKQAQPSVPIEEVESAEEIVKRFATGAMSYGSISREAHETLAIAMNRIGGRSNSGEGGEDPERYYRDANGDWRNSAIKQVASGRFGVTSNYLVNASDLQIKMAQGAKPGEG